MSYARMFTRKLLPAGTYVFVDADTLHQRYRERLAELWDDLSNSGWDNQLFNHPLRAMGRYDLLRELHRRGMNDFNIYRPHEAPRSPRYPVFVRTNYIRDPGISGLLYSRSELKKTLDRFAARVQDRDEVYIVEFTDVSDASGRYHTYGAYRVGPRILPAYVEFNRHWITRDFKTHPYEEDRQAVAANEEYVQQNPHAAQLMTIFELAGIDYGRIDYAVVDGSIRVFEINTNPAIFAPGYEEDPRWLPAQRLFWANMEQALLGIDNSGAASACRDSTGNRSFANCVEHVRG